MTSPVTETHFANDWLSHEDFENHHLILHTPGETGLYVELKENVMSAGRFYNPPTPLTFSPSITKSERKTLGTRVFKNYSWVLITLGRCFTFQQLLDALREPNYVHLKDDVTPYSEVGPDAPCMTCRSYHCSGH